MVEVTALARRYKTEINIGSIAVPNWQILFGVVEFSPPVEPVNQTDTDYESDGWKGNTKTAQEWSVELKLSHKVDADNNELNTVHKFLKAASRNFGSASIVPIRYFDRSGNDDAQSGYAIVTWAPEGGDMEQLDQVTVTFNASSYDPALTIITNPVGTNPIPLVGSVSPATGDELGGNLVMITGAYFIDADGVAATAVNFGATPATSFSVVNNSVIAAVAPAGAVGTVAVRVTTGAGQSADTAADNYIYT